MKQRARIVDDDSEHDSFETTHGGNDVEPTSKRARLITTPASAPSASHQPDVLRDLRELQSCGFKVVMPTSAAPCAPLPMERRAEVSIESTDRQLERFDDEVLQDWLDLAELGGTPTWPQGITCQDVHSELSRRKRAT